MIDVCAVPHRQTDREVHRESEWEAERLRKIEVLSCTVRNVRVQAVSIDLSISASLCVCVARGPLRHSLDSTARSL